MNDKPIGLVLSKSTSSLRLYLLIFSLIDFLVINVRFFPKEINTFGITMNEFNYPSLLILILILTSFFMITFTFFASVDWMNYRLLFVTNEMIYDWEKRNINLSVDKYKQAINELSDSLAKGIGRIQEKIQKMDFIFLLPKEHSFITLKKRVKKYLTMAKIFQFVLPIVEIILPATFGVYSIIIILIELTY